MATITGGQIKDWLAGMDELTPCTRNNQMVDLHAAFETAKTWNLISENPLGGIQKFNVSKAPEIGILTPEQLSAFLNVVDTKFIPFFTINAFTGLRRAEVETIENEIRAASDKFYSALNRMLNGDAGPLGDIWSHSPTVTTMHPIGGREVGWDQVRGSWEQVAQLATHGQVRLSDQFIQVAGDVWPTNWVSSMDS